MAYVGTSTCWQHSLPVYTYQHRDRGEIRYFTTGHRVASASSIAYGSKPHTLSPYDLTTVGRAPTPHIPCDHTLSQYRTSHSIARGDSVLP
eukprot:3344611-Rhodomonas_salina.1